MPYASGEVPVVGDQVKHAKTGRTAIVTHVDKDPLHTSSPETVTVGRDDDEEDVDETLPAREFVLISRAEEMAG